MKKNVLNYYQLYELLEKITENDIGMFVGAVGMAYHQKHINFHSMRGLLNAMLDKFNTSH